MAGPETATQNASLGTSVPAALEKDQTTLTRKLDELSCEDAHKAIDRRYDPFTGYFVKKLLDASVPSCVPGHDSESNFRTKEPRPMDPPPTAKELEHWENVVSALWKERGMSVPSWENVRQHAERLAHDYPPERRADIVLKRIRGEATPEADRELPFSEVDSWKRAFVLGGAAALGYTLPAPSDDKQS